MRSFIAPNSTEAESQASSSQEKTWSEITGRRAAALLHPLERALDPREEPGAIDVPVVEQARGVALFGREHPREEVLDGDLVERPGRGAADGGLEQTRGGGSQLPDQQLRFDAHRRPPVSFDGARSGGSPGLKTAAQYCSPRRGTHSQIAPGIERRGVARERRGPAGPEERRGACARVGGMTTPLGVIALSLVGLFLLKVDLSRFSSISSAPESASSARSRWRRSRRRPPSRSLRSRGCPSGSSSPSGSSATRRPSASPGGTNSSRRPWRAAAPSAWSW